MQKTETVQPCPRSSSGTLLFSQIIYYNYEGNTPLGQKHGKLASLTCFWRCKLRSRHKAWLHYLAGHSLKKKKKVHIWCWDTWYTHVKDLQSSKAGIRITAPGDGPLKTSQQWQLPYFQFPGNSLRLFQDFSFKVSMNNRVLWEDQYPTGNKPAWNQLSARGRCCHG